MLFYQILVYLSMVFVSFIIINQVVMVFLRVDYLLLWLWLCWVYGSLAMRYTLKKLLKRTQVNTKQTPIYSLFFVAKILLLDDDFKLSKSWVKVAFLALKEFYSGFGSCGVVCGDSSDTDPF
ncbi:MAG: hypothetical protein HFP77_00125 [Methylococcales symbiont of Iophon sp. n. MRB-2018]|nr:MAG: hypothetical protein HFP77_00125 [Methylococcales symbiont of Iophon sp. n. MRB-2018]